MFKVDDFDQKRITKAFKDFGLSEKFNAVVRSNGVEKIKLFKEYCKKLIEIYDTKLVSRMELAYMVTSFIFDQELTDEKQSNETANLIYRAGELEIPPGATTIEDELIDDEKYEFYWNEWRNKLEKFINN